MDSSNTFRKPVLRRSYGVHKDHIGSRKRHIDTVLGLPGNPPESNQDNVILPHVIGSRKPYMFNVGELQSYMDANPLPLQGGRRKRNTIKKTRSSKSRRKSFKRIQSKRRVSRSFSSRK